MHEQTSIQPHPHGYSLPAAPTPDTTHGTPRERLKMIIVLFVSHVWLTAELFTSLIQTPILTLAHKNPHQFHLKENYGIYHKWTIENTLHWALAGSVVLI